ncbi:MAG: DUF1016 N-terminal domain-containing protein, partial [Spirochaetota bacterium]
MTKSNVVRSVNSNMILAYWLIGREIVEELQKGDERAEYGREIIESLSTKLNKKFGKGFSAATLWRFRQLYQVYPERIEILAPTGRELKFKFHPELSWSHYRALMRVNSEKGLLAENNQRERLPGEPMQASQFLKSPMVLEFLGLPDSPALREPTLEQAIINNLQS